MKTKVNKLSEQALRLAGMAVLALSLSSCSVDDTTTTDSFFDQVGLMRLSMVFPAYEQKDVAITTTYSQLQFSKAVNPNSLPGSFVVRELVDGTINDITASTVVTLSPSDPRLVQLNFALPGNQLKDQAQYSITVLQTLTSATGEPSLPAEHRYATGNAGSGFGGISVSGPPKISSVAMTRSTVVNCGCVTTLYVIFNEDVQSSPRLTVKLKDLLRNDEFPVFMTRSVGGRSDQWYAHLVNRAYGGCTYSVGSTATLEATLDPSTVFDMGGIRMDATNFSTHSAINSLTFKNNGGSGFWSNFTYYGFCS